MQQPNSYFLRDYPLEKLMFNFKEQARRTTWILFVIRVYEDLYDRANSCIMRKPRKAGELFKYLSRTDKIDERDVTRKGIKKRGKEEGQFCLCWIVVIEIIYDLQKEEIFLI